MSIKSTKASHAGRSYCSKENGPSAIATIYPCVWHSLIESTVKIYLVCLKQMFYPVAMLDAVCKAIEQALEYALPCRAMGTIAKHIPSCSPLTRNSLNWIKHHLWSSAQPSHYSIATLSSGFAPHCKITWVQLGC